MIPAASRFLHPLAAGIVLLTFLPLALASTVQAGTLSGRVAYDGLMPERHLIMMSSDPACDKIFPNGRPSEIVVVSPEHGLANVLVYVKSGLDKDFRAPAPAAPAVVDQRGCAFVPHVIGVRAGQEVEFRNSDAAMHNVNARSQVNSPFNDAMPAEGQVILKTFPYAEMPVKLKCDIHPWMSAYVGVFSHPFFAVTAGDGSFAIASIPEGDYTIEAWHESLGVQSAEIEIDDKDDATLTFSFVGN